MKNASRSRKFGILIAAIVCLGVGNVAYAVGNGPCAEDVQKFCKDVGRRGVGKCLKEHEAELAPACKQKIAQAKQKAQDFSKACKSDVSKLCKDIQPGGGRMLQCLKQHESELSDECQKALASGK